MTEHLKRITVLAAIATACLAGLGACGGDTVSKGDGLTQQEREDRAASSWPGMLVFAQGQISAATNETAEPRPIAGITAPTDDTGEPLPL